MRAILIVLGPLWFNMNVAIDDVICDITGRYYITHLVYFQVTMANREAAERACKDPNPIIDGRKANVNLAYLGAKPRGIQTGMYSCAERIHVQNVGPLNHFYCVNTTLQYATMTVFSLNISIVFSFAQI